VNVLAMVTQEGDEMSAHLYDSFDSHFEIFEGCIIITT
jgi:hypothetical protein